MEKVADIICFIVRLHRLCVVLYFKAFFGRWQVLFEVLSAVTVIRCQQCCVGFINKDVNKKQNSCYSAPCRATTLMHDSFMQPPNGACPFHALPLHYKAHILYPPTQHTHMRLSIRFLCQFVLSISSGITASYPAETGKSRPPLIIIAVC